MPFIRQTRDKRGFEQTVVMHSYHPAGGGPSRPRVLYLFRTPVHIRIGRKALEPEVMEALEHTHPDLSFDWNSLLRDQVTAKAEPFERRPHRSREDREPPRVPDDGSVLGRVVGAAEAARLRQRYSELVQRVERRAVTPEDRARLLDRAKRLNPDDWPDEAAIRAELPGIEGASRAINLELPSRRRGRRGGRRQEGGRTPSAIMDRDTGQGRGDDEVVHEQMAETRPSGDDRSGGDAGGGNTGGADPAEAAERPGDPILD